MWHRHEAQDVVRIEGPSCLHNDLALIHNLVDKFDGVANKPHVVSRSVAVTNAAFDNPAFSPALDFEDALQLDREEELGNVPNSALL